MTDYPTTIQSRPLLSPRRRGILRFIADYTATNGAPPSVREISEGVGMRGWSSAYAHITRLVEGGLVTRKPHVSRAVIVTAAGRDALADDADAAD